MCVTAKLVGTHMRMCYRQIDWLPYAYMCRQIYLHTYAYMRTARLIDLLAHIYVCITARLIRTHMCICYRQIDWLTYTFVLPPDWLAHICVVYRQID